MKKQLALILCILTFVPQVFAGSFKEHYDLGKQYVENYQYASAIVELKNALRINYMDNSARILITKAYTSSGYNYAKNEANYEAAANDYRSALFYMTMFPRTDSLAQQSDVEIVKKNLNNCLSMLPNFKRDPASRYEYAKKLRADGNFAAAAYEFTQAFSDKILVKDAYVQIGDIMKILGNDPKALEYYKTAVRLSPNNMSLRLAYAKLLDKNNEESAAVEEYNTILSQQNVGKDVLYALERIYRKKLEDSPSDAGLNANMGAILQKQEKYDEALAYYKKSKQLDPSNLNTQINLGTLYQQKGDFKTAIVIYDSVLIIEPTHLAANLHKAQCEAELGNTQKAREIYKKILANDPNNEIAKNELFNVAKSTMTTAQYIDYVKKNGSGIDTTSLLYDYATDLHKKNKLADAILAYNAILDKDSNGDIYTNLAIAQSANGNTDAALATLAAAKNKFPNNSLISETYNNIKENELNKKLDIAADYFNTKDYNNAIQAYLSIDPPTADTMLAVASAYQNLDDNSNAIKYYKKALELKPADANIAYYIAALYYDLEDLASAEAYAQKALLLNKNHTDAKTLLATIKETNNSNELNTAISLFDSQKYDESLSVLNRLIGEDSQNAYAHYYRAMIYDAKNNLEAAINDYKKVLSAKLEDLNIVNYMLGIDYDNLGKYKEAYGHYIAYAQSSAPEDEYKTYAKTRAEELKDYATKTN